MPLINADNISGIISNNPLAAGDVTLTTTDGSLALLNAVSPPDRMRVVIRPGTVNQEIVYVMRHGREKPSMAPRPPRILVALTSGVAPASLEVDNGPVYANASQVRVTYLDSILGVQSQVWTVNGTGTTAQHIVLSAPANATYSFPVGSILTPVGTSTLAQTTTTPYSFQVTYVTADGETETGPGNCSFLLAGASNTDQIVIILGDTHGFVMPSDVTGVKFYKIAGPGNNGLMTDVISGATTIPAASFVSGVVIAKFSAPGDNTNFAPTTNTTKSVQSATIWRGQENTTAISHPQNSAWQVMATSAVEQERLALGDNFPRGADDAWLQAQWNCANQASWVLGIGSSSLMGPDPCTDVMSKSYFARTRAIVRARPGITDFGDFFPCSYSTNWGGAVRGTQPFTMNVAPNGNSSLNWGYDGPGITPHWTATSAQDYMTFVAPSSTTLGYTVQSAEIHYWDAGPNGATWKYSVNGGADTTVTLTNSNTLKKVSINNLVTPWTIKLRQQSATDVARIYGVGVFPGTTGPGTSGIGWVWFLYGGTSMLDFANMGGSPSDRIALWAGPTIQAGVGSNVSTGFGFPMQPSLVIIDHAADIFIDNRTGFTRPQMSPVYGCSPNYYANGFRRFDTAFQAGRSDRYGCSVLLHVPAVPSLVTSDQLNVGFDPAMDTYYPYMETVAHRLGWMVADTNEAWVSERTLSQGFQMMANGHATDGGNDEIARRITGRYI